MSIYADPAGPLLRMYAALTQVSVQLSTRQVDPFGVGNEELDPLLADYHEEMADLVARAQDGELTQDEFEQEMEILVTSTFLLVFSQGSGSEELPLLAVMAMEQELMRAREGIARLADDVYAGRYDIREGETAEEAAERLGNRLVLWGASAAGMYALGQLHVQNADRVKYEWVLGPTTESCEDCLRLAGQIHTAEAWNQSGWRPQSSALSCRGFNCRCSLLETDAEINGDF